MLLPTSGRGAIHRRPTAGLARRRFTQYVRAPDLAPLRAYSLELENPPFGHLPGQGDREFESVRSAGESVIRRADVATDRGFITAHPWDRAFRGMRRSRVKQGLGNGEVVITLTS